MKKTFLYVGAMLLFCSPFLVKAVPWERPTDNAPNANVDGPVWISPTTPQQGYVDLISSSDTTSLKLDPEATATPFNDLSIDPTNTNSQPGLSINDGRSSAIPAASLWVTSSLSDKPAIYGYNDTSGYGGQFIGTSAPGLMVQGGVRFGGDTVDPSTYQTAGLLYYNTTDNAFKYYNGSTWRQLNTPWEINGDEIYHSQTTGTAKGVAIKTGDTTDPNDNYTLDVFRKAQTIGVDRALYSRLEMVDPDTGYVSGTLGGYANNTQPTGVIGKADLANGIGVYGEGETGGVFRASSLGSRGIEVFAVATNATAGYFQASGDSGVGVHASAGPLTPTATALALKLDKGAMAMQELTTLPTNTLNYGKLYVKSADSKIYFQDDSGTEYDLTSGGDANWDTDGDTGIELEETADDDTIRFDTAGIERMHIKDNGNLFWGDYSTAQDYISGNVAYGGITLQSTDRVSIGDNEGMGNATEFIVDDANNKIYTYNNMGIGTNSSTYQLNVTESASAGRAVYAEATATGANTNYGGYFTAAGDTGIGVYGEAITGGSSSIINYGGYFAGGSSEGGIGVYGEGLSRGVHGVGLNTGYGTSISYGGYFESIRTDGGIGRGLYATGNTEAARFEGAEVVISDGAPGTQNYATAAGELYVENDIESDGSIYAATAMQAPIFRDLNNAAYYLDPASSTSGRFYGNLDIGYGSGTDDDFLNFDQNNEYLKWDYKDSRFEFSNDLSVLSLIAYSNDIYIDYDSRAVDDFIYFGGVDSELKPNPRQGFIQYNNVEGHDRFILSAVTYADGVLLSSDARLKTDVKDIISPLQIVNALEPVSFDWKEDGKASYGFIAQEMYDVLPELVYKPIEGSEDYWGIEYSKLTSILTAAMQEQQEKIESQQKEIDELKEQEQRESQQKEIDELKEQVKYLMDKVE